MSAAIVPWSRDFAEIEALLGVEACPIYGGNDCWCGAPLPDGPVHVVIIERTPELVCDLCWMLESALGPGELAREREGLWP